MIDIHCHILPGLDDGASNLAESLTMAQYAVNEGIHTIVATPHHKNNRYTNVAEDIISNVEYFNEKLQQKNIPLTIIPGQETRIHGDMLQDLDRGEMLPYNKTSRYILMDLPNDGVPHYLTQLLFDLQIAGYQPIIAHPERNHALVEKPDILYRLVKNGALTQVSAASLAGVKGNALQKFTSQLLAANLTHFVASDAHHAKRKTFHMREAFHFIRKQHGHAMAHQLMKNSELLIAGSNILPDAPERIEIKKTWGFFKAFKP